jgi:hypothetical protein
VRLGEFDSLLLCLCVLRTMLVGDWFVFGLMGMGFLVAQDVWGRVGRDTGEGRSWRMSCVMTRISRIEGGRRQL